jgi:hypothetical protein
MFGLLSSRLFLQRFPQAFLEVLAYAHPVDKIIRREERDAHAHNMAKLAYSINRGLRVVVPDIYIESNDQPFDSICHFSS